MQLETCEAISNIATNSAGESFVTNTPQAPRNLTLNRPLSVHATGPVRRLVVTGDGTDVTSQAGTHLLGRIAQQLAVAEVAAAVMADTLTRSSARDRNTLLQSGVEPIYGVALPGIALAHNNGAEVNRVTSTRMMIAHTGHSVDIELEGVVRDIARQVLHDSEITLHEV